MITNRSLNLGTETAFSVLAKANKLADQGKEIINLGIGQPDFLTNKAGGILGGISTGQPIIIRFAIKPTSSILTPRRSIDRFDNEVEVRTKGRHDPCVGIRAVPVGEAMAACVIADHVLRHQAQCLSNSTL